MEQQVFDTWNQFRSERNSKGVWKRCTVLDGFTKSTIRQALRAHGGTERVMAAITNYHTWWAGKEYKWTYGWTLCQFLTRKDKGKVPQLRRFLPENFVLEENLKDSVKAQRAAIAKAEAAKNRYELSMKSAPAKPPRDWRKEREDKRAITN